MCRKIFLVLVGIIALSSPVFADYWAIGAFKMKANAERERDRIARETGLPIVVVQTIDGSDVYRVVLEQDKKPGAQKMALIDAGLSPWPVSMNEVTEVVRSEGSMSNETTGHLLVLGSFPNELSAVNLSETLASKGVDMLGIASADVSGRTYYRVVHGPFMDKSMVLTDFSQLGIDGAWWLTSSGAVSGNAMLAQDNSSQNKTSKNMDANDAGYQSQSQSQNETNEAAAAEEMAEAARMISPPNADESYVDYCLGRANAEERVIYCRNGVFNRIAKARRQMSESRAETLEYCLLHATGAERREKCKDTSS